MFRESYAGAPNGPTNVLFIYFIDPRDVGIANICGAPEIENLPGLAASVLGRLAAPSRKRAATSTSRPALRALGGSNPGSTWRLMEFGSYLGLDSKNVTGVTYIIRPVGAP